jgi:uncharacterized protein YigE (DUF2233 family)
VRHLAALALLALAACDQQPAAGPVTRAEIGGKDLAKAAPSPEPTKLAESDCRQVTFEDVPLTHCVADPAKHTISTALNAPDGDPARSLAVLKDMYPESASVAFAMNGGMFDDNGRPIGYYVEEGERTKTLNRNTGAGNFHMLPNGVFFGSDGKWQVRTAEDFEKNVGDRPEFGTQSGPMLVIAGKLHPEIAEDGPSRAIRNGVCVDAAGRAHFVISDGPLSFGKLARYFRDELNCANALYLDGAVSALWDPASDRLDALAPLGPLIVVVKREKAAA